MLLCPVISGFNRSCQTGGYTTLWRDKPPHHRNRSGFTLIELSIVLVIIGLIVGGIVVGQHLVKSAAVQAQISQIQKYNSAVHTFQTKYGGLPGDLNVTLASQFGFTTTACTGQQGQRDGNGLIDGYISPYLLLQGAGETYLFWQDLSAAALIDDTFPSGGGVSSGCNLVTALTLTTGATYIGNFYPTGKIGFGTFVLVYENNGYNWFDVSTISNIATVSGAVTSSAGIPVMQAYNIDKKIDDGVPTTGNVMATYLNLNGSPSFRSTVQTAPNTTTSGGNSASCYDTTTNTYSTSISSRNAPNCALSFQFQ